MTKKELVEAIGKARDELLGHKDYHLDQFKFDKAIEIVDKFDNIVDSIEEEFISENTDISSIIKVIAVCGAVVNLKDIKLRNIKFH